MAIKWPTCRVHLQDSTSKLTLYRTYIIYLSVIWKKYEHRLHQYHRNELLTVVNGFIQNLTAVTIIKAYLDILLYFTHASNLKIQTDLCMTIRELNTNKIRRENVKLKYIKKCYHYKLKKIDRFACNIKLLYQYTIWKNYNFI